MLKKTLGLACIMTLVTATANAAEEYPTRDIRMIVPWGAGGGTDGIVRKITDLAEESLSGTVYVENIEGGMSGNGLIQLINAKADGYTLGALTYDSVITVPWQDMLPGYSVDEMDLIARITSEPDALIVPADSEHDSIEALIEAAKAEPGRIRAGIQNMGARTHLTLLQLMDATGADFKIISYPGGAAPQKEALLNGEIDFAITSLGDFASLIEGGDARGLIEFTDVQSQSFPDVPPASERDLDIQMGSFIILAAPAGTPEPILDELEAAYQEAYESDEFQGWLVDVGVTPNWLGRDEVTEWVGTTQEEIFVTMEELQEQGILD
ncbi:tripartite tricarboxylate transporter substrate binding protein [Halomonas sp. LR3S48]|uniref:Bug family tripartite tricarboxylate transporter substrate binding protein n=1 Tax=Halomonadaceae TaxID=28256 RepID=UPI0021E3F310|nr:tripartite tricarboxylate transporter substrate binding protein [Halomonas sp. LR3S48]UYG03672.1 tripartite tricarboxylate transporter substrate binding protein [Halomonas sp. LR3S48]